MYLCYIDESGTSDIPGTTSHFVLAGICIPISRWRDCDNQIEALKRFYAIENKEIHVAWLAKEYVEQNQIPNFDALDYNQRRYEVQRLRTSKIFALQKVNNPKKLQQTKKNYAKSEDYIHLTHSERKEFLLKLATCVSKWDFAYLFAECVDKLFFDPRRSFSSIDEGALEQVVSRFEQFLQKCPQGKRWGLLIHDNNLTIAQKHTELMKEFHIKGTLWTKVKHIIETPLFVDSQLTSMVQIGDLCAYALRRYLENSERTLFDLIYKRAHSLSGVVVGVRHFSDGICKCIICVSHKYKSRPRKSVRK
jgi:hypothetical protein